MKKLERVLLISILTIFGLAGLLATRYINKQEQLLSQTQDSLQTFQTIVTERGEQLVLQEQKIISLEFINKTQKALLDSLHKIGIKNVTTIVQLKTEIKRLKIELDYKPDPIIDTIIIQDGTELLKTYLKVPQYFEHSGDPWFYTNGYVKSTGVTLDSTVVFSQPSIVLGQETGYFKKAAPIVVYSDRNPYTTVIDMNNLVIRQKPRFYKTPWWYRAEGAALMFVTTIGVNALIK